MAIPSIMGGVCDNHILISCAECAKALLTIHNVEMNVQNKLGDTPLHNASWKGHAEVVALLLEKGTIIDLVYSGASDKGHSERGQTSLQRARADILTKLQSLFSISATDTII